MPCPLSLMVPMRSSGGVPATVYVAPSVCFDAGMPRNCLGLECRLSAFTGRPGERDDGTQFGQLSRQQGEARAAAMRPKPPPAVRVSGGRNTRFADAGGHAPEKPVTTQSSLSARLRDRMQKAGQQTSGRGSRRKEVGEARRSSFLREGVLAWRTVLRGVVVAASAPIGR